MIKITSTGNLKKINGHLQRMLSAAHISWADKYGQRGVEALANATPVDSGLTASSWSYCVERSKESLTISWHNDNEVDGVPVVILLQYGHATIDGRYVPGNDFIGPALAPLIEEMEAEVQRGIRG